MANLPTPKRPDKQSSGLFGRKIALGAWAWGNDGTFGNNLTAESLKPIFDTAMENGLNLWDTAYAYGKVGNCGKMN